MEFTRYFIEDPRKKIFVSVRIWRNTKGAPYFGHGSTESDSVIESPCPSLSVCLSVCDNSKHPHVWDCGSIYGPARWTWKALIVPPLCQARWRHLAKKVLKDQKIFESPRLAAQVKNITNELGVQSGTDTMLNKKEYRSAVNKTDRTPECCMTKWRPRLNAPGPSPRSTAGRPHSKS